VCIHIFARHKAKQRWIVRCLSVHPSLYDSFHLMSSYLLYSFQAHTHTHKRARARDQTFTGVCKLNCDRSTWLAESQTRRLGSTFSGSPRHAVYCRAVCRSCYNWPSTKQDLCKVPEYYAVHIYIQCMHCSRRINIYIYTPRRTAKVRASSLCV